MTQDCLDLYREIEARLTAPDGQFALESVSYAGRRVLAYRHRGASLSALIEQAEVRFGDRNFIWEDGRFSTYAVVVGRGYRLAAGLAGKYGVGPRTLVGVIMRNRTEWFECFIAIQRLGATAVLINSRGSPDELAAAAAEVPCAVILADDERAERLRSGGAQTPIVSLDELNALIAAEPGPAPAAAADPEAPAVVPFTSGTTGRPKGAVLTQFNLTNMAHTLLFSQIINMELAAVLAGISLETLQANRAVPSALMISPLFHLSGISTFFSTIASGGMLTVLRRWNAEDAMDLIESHKVTSFTGPPMVLAELIERPEASKKLATLGSFSIAGQATPVSLLRNVQAILPRMIAGTGWGSTEISASVAVASGPVLMLKPESAGLPLPISEVSIRDEQGRPVPNGEAGEIWVRGALVMQGYWNRPEATAAALEDGWYKSGDIGTIDDRGFIQIVDRLKDMVISGGENIYSAEVERVLGSDPAIVEVAVFGVPDPRLGERVVAAVNLNRGEGRSENDIKAFARKYLADYKVPAEVVMDLGPLPRNTVGKVEKPKLRALFLARTQGEV